MTEQPKPIIDHVPDFNKTDAANLAALCKDLLQSPGWNYLQGILRQSKKEWEAILRTTDPVAGGAAQMARAQGALIAIDQALVLPEATLKVCLERIAEVE